VFIIYAPSYDQVLVAISRLGAAVNRDGEASQAVEDLSAAAEDVLARAREAARDRPAPRVLILTGGGRDVFVGGDDTYIGGLVALLGGENVLAEVPEGGPLAGFGVVGVSESAIQMPDVVLILPSGEGGLADQIAADPAWASVPAVVNNRIHEVDRDLFLRVPGPRVAEALRVLEALLWP
jgi:iron complex transport system substrate-binding protein